MLSTKEKFCWNQEGLFWDWELVPRVRFFRKQPPKKAQESLNINDSRKLEYNPEVDRELYFSTWAVFIKNNSTFVLQKHQLTYVSFCGAVSLLIFLDLWYCKLYIPHFPSSQLHSIYTLLQQNCGFLCYDPVISEMWKFAIIFLYFLFQHKTQDIWWELEKLSLN